jgi:RNA polymerase sigma factor (sigma-70 family)
MLRLKGQGVSLQNAKDAFQEALITLDQHIRSGNFDRNKPLKPYFMGICEGRAFSNKRSTKRIDTNEEMPIIITPDTPETETLETERKEILRQLLQKLDDKCRVLLTHYMLSFSMKEIRELMNISSDSLTRKMASGCRQKLAELIDANPRLKRYLKNE